MPDNDWWTYKADIQNMALPLSAVVKEDPDGSDDRVFPGCRLCPAS